MKDTAMRSLLTTSLIALLFGFGGAALWGFTGLGHQQTRAYLLDNPEILPEMVENFEKAQARERLASAGSEVFNPFPGAVLGNPDGAVTLVEFTDYGCSFCRMSRPHIEALIAANPDLKVVIREWAIFEGSDKAALMALAAAKQDKFAAFHKAMFEQGSPTANAIRTAADNAGLNWAEAQTFIGSQEASAELSKNQSLARELGFGGTPSWVIGDQAFEGAIGEDKLQDAIDAARRS